jgi:hypothetical protein
VASAVFKARINGTFANLNQGVKMDELVAIMKQLGRLSVDSLDELFTGEPDDELLLAVRRLAKLYEGVEIYEEDALGTAGSQPEPSGSSQDPPDNGQSSSAPTNTCDNHRTRLFDLTCRAGQWIGDHTPDFNGSLKPRPGTANNIKKAAQERNQQRNATQ